MLEALIMTDYNLVVEQRWSSHPCNVHNARISIREFVSRYALDFVDLIELAIGEACANAVEHGSPAGDCNHFTLRCGLAPSRKEMVFEVEDERLDFALKSVSAQQAPDLESEGGRGLFLMNQIMDDVSLMNSNRGQVVRMTKRIAQAS